MVATSKNVEVAAEAEEVVMRRLIRRREPQLAFCANGGRCDRRELARAERERVRTAATLPHPIAWR